MGGGEDRCEKGGVKGVNVFNRLFGGIGGGGGERGGGMKGGGKVE